MEQNQTQHQGLERRQSQVQYSGKERRRLDWPFQGLQERKEEQAKRAREQQESYRRR